MRSCPCSPTKVIRLQQLSPAQLLTYIETHQLLFSITLLSTCHLFFLSYSPSSFFDIVSLLAPPVEEYSVGSATDLTETSSVVDGDWTMVDENSSTLSLSQAELEHISMELANKGPHKSQVQLR